mgnify:CR=1 FL=1
MRYNPALDGLRAVAIVAVVAFHCRVPFMTGGYFGVDLFFVLSGYLITSLLAHDRDRHGTIDLQRFYWNRLVRLMPVLVAVVLAVYALGLTTPGKAAIALFYLTDIFAPFDHEFGILSHTWSLSVEEHFYLLWPLALPVLLRAKNPALWALGLFVGATIWRVTWFPVLPYEETYYRFDARLSGLLLGSALALTKINLEAAELARIGKFSACALVFAAVSIPIFTATSLLVAQPLVEIAAAGLLVAALNESTKLHAILARPVLVQLGRWSYGIYLWHYPVAFVLREHLWWLQTLLLTSAISVALAALTYRAIEIPFRRFRLERVLRPATGS